jgi:hypothetical protein
VSSADDNIGVKSSAQQKLSSASASRPGAPKEGPMTAPAL